MLFAKKYHEDVFGIIEGLDRIRFRGTDRMLNNIDGFGRMLNIAGVLLKDFGKWAEKTTKRLRKSCAEQADVLGIPIKYLTKSGVDKEAMARKIAQEKGIARDGSICMFSVVESCVSPSVLPNRESKQIEVEMRPRKCVYIYYYFDHPRVGFGNVRLQAWAPYTVNICLNGRHWLEKQLLANGVKYRKIGNCFPWVSDVAAAQSMMEEQLRTDWPELLNGLLQRMCPILPGLCAPYDIHYYWSAYETEFATDVMFRSKAKLDALFPKFLTYGMTVSDCKAVLRYFGKCAPDSSRGRIPNQIQSDCRKRYEGVRIKHWVNGDSVKMYNKQGTVLRVETTINNARNFKAFRPANDDASKPCTWQKMRKGVNDLHRRCEISRHSNERYLDAVGALEVDKTLHETVKDVCNRTTRHGRSVRGFNPWNELDNKLLTFLGKGEWAINGFRNKQLRAWLDPNSGKRSEQDRKKLASKTTRLIGMLRAHGLIRKVSKENRYVVTQEGQTLASALLAASNVGIKQLTKKAA